MIHIHLYKYLTCPTPKTCIIFPPFSYLNPIQKMNHHYLLYYHLLKPRYYHKRDLVGLCTTILSRTRTRTRLRPDVLHSSFTTSSEGDGVSWRNVDGLIRCEANYTPLTPVTFLDRSAKVFPDRISVVHGCDRYTWSETRHRCRKLASALTTILGVSSGHLVATLAPNVPAMYELHFAVPMARAVLCTLNSRLDSSMVSTLLAHSKAKVLFVDFQLLNIASEALHLLSKHGTKPPLLILIKDSDSDTDNCKNDHQYDYEYESFLAKGDEHFEPLPLGDEWDPISVNYTSGTTSRPKGVVYSHRGAYLNAISTFLLHDMSPSLTPTYLWTVPMFHCNGWCLPWGVAALGGTNICLRKVTPKAIFENIFQHNVTHMGAAPTVLNMIVNSLVSDQRVLPHKVKVMTGGSPPPPQILAKMEELGFEVGHLYGLTETYGPGTYCVSKPEWDSLPSTEKSRFKARQDTKATNEAFKGGWFHSSDMAIKHPDNYIEVKDRLKDIIISGGENISTVMVETVLYSHPAVLEAAVVARPDDHWGETPCAFVKLKDGCDGINEEEIIMFCREHLPHYMAPKTVIFQEIPKTTTGKVQKFILRERAKAL
ncbi:putative acyl-activating enzyme 2 [Bienertia sinuspersici]